MSAIGYWDVPSFQWNNQGAHPAVLVTRTQTALTNSSDVPEFMDFGTPGQYLFMGLRYRTATGSTYVLRDLGVSGAGPLSFRVTGNAGSSLRISDAFGNFREQSIDSDGKFMLQLNQLPQFVLVPQGVTLVAPKFEFGPNYARNITKIAWDGAPTDRPCILLLPYL